MKKQIKQLKELFNSEKIAVEKVEVEDNHFFVVSTSKDHLGMDTIAKINNKLWFALKISNDNISIQSISNKLSFAINWHS